MRAEDKARPDETRGDIKYMGGEQFTAFSKFTDAAKAFEDARQRALYDHGHSGYSGTIAEKPGFELRPTSQKLTQKEAYGFADKDGDDNEKWGDAYAIPVYDETREKVVGYLFYGWASS